MSKASAPNRSSAVMQQRQDARDALDDFPTPMWATRALCEWLLQDYNLEASDVREPCANRGYMVRPLSEYFGEVIASDVHDYGAGFAVEDYLFGPDQARVDWTIANPPFCLAFQFIERALRTSTTGIAIFVRAAFLEGEARFADLFSQYPPTAVLQFAERVVIHKSAMRQKGAKYWDHSANKGKGAMKSASSATAYIWIVWDIADLAAKQEFMARPMALLHWIAPCQKRLERVGDYELLGDLAA